MAGFLFTGSGLGWLWESAFFYATQKAILHVLDHHRRFSVLALLLLLAPAENQLLPSTVRGRNVLSDDTNIDYGRWNGGIWEL